MIGVGSPNVKRGRLGSLCGLSGIDEAQPNSWNWQPTLEDPRMAMSTIAGVPLQNTGYIEREKKGLPRWTALYAWQALQERIATKSVLVRKNIIPQNQNLCPFCSISF
ncbi:hypothetical protein RHGRI_020383 [Rhododendron griersonianum]|uniref:Uncharacterized protein n=1 Tax=Rhododendron griersonianum TaxID=479676 RepID=A0AAV6JHC8_9ERIC|nr:hypothetical protein RHGRI_020383 [Rhododendron griersonianum]